MKQHHVFGLDVDDPECNRLRDAIKQGHAVAVDGLDGSWFVERVQIIGDTAGFVMARFSVLGPVDA